MRSNFGMELYLGNHEGARGYIMGWKHPVWNDEEMERYRSLGEIAYVHEKGRTARAWIASHPAEFVRLSLTRCLIFWAGVPERTRVGPFDNVQIRHAMYFSSSVLALWGALLACRRRLRGASLYLGLFALYPLVYYITHNHARYRAPIEPLMMLSGMALMIAAFNRVSAQTHANASLTSARTAVSTRTHLSQRRSSPPLSARTRN
jgi:hypothetical protein